MIFPRSCVTSENISNTKSQFALLAFALFFSACSVLLFNGCSSINSIQNNLNDTTSRGSSPDLQSQALEESSKTITMAFAGDIMAHKINYQAGNFSRVFEDISPLLKSCDLAFGNIEAPVNNQMEWQTYPQFNMHTDYIEEAVKAGFNVFSLTNNHTNDWYLEGIKATREYFAKQKNIWAAGLRQNSNSPVSYTIIEKNDFRVLFVPVTEILNRNDYSSYINYYPAKKHGELIRQLNEITARENFDIFILSIHTDEEEYKTKVTESHRAFYHRLIEECGVDVIWANHPHCYKEFEKISLPGKKTDFSTADSGNSTVIHSPESFIMYANGNTISGQRTNPSFGKAPNERDDTGDGLIIKVEFKKQRSTKVSIHTESTSSAKAENSPEQAAVSIQKIEPHLITSYIQPNGQIVIRLADEDFVHCLNRSGLRTWAKYINSRITIYENLKGKSKWQ